MLHQIRLFKNFLKRAKYTKDIYLDIKYILTPTYKQKIIRNFFFYNCSKKSEKCCIILAGYKEFLWEKVFERIKAFVPPDIDVCISSSGLYSDKLLEICKNNNWSYISTKRNSIPQILNISINAFPQAKFIFKIDEDIFITKNFFEKIFKCYENCKESDFIPGFVGPLIPLNGYGHMQILKRLSLVSIYTQLFETPKYAVGQNRMLENSSNVAKFFWGSTGHIPHIDILNEYFEKQNFSFSVCPIRFSIGAILFTRTLWEKMGFFIGDKASGLGSDEFQICSLAMSSANAIIVAENTVVGHLSFGLQNNEMKKYFQSNPDKFSLYTTESR
jgi:hypothetical protein